MKRQEELKNKLKENEQFFLSLFPFHLKITNDGNTLGSFTSTQFQWKTGYGKHKLTALFIGRTN